MAGIEGGLGQAACSQARCSTVGTNNAAQAPLEPVRRCGSSGSSRRCRIAYDTGVASDTPPGAAPARSCTILSNLFACGISSLDGGKYYGRMLVGAINDRAYFLKSRAGILPV